MKKVSIILLLINICFSCSKEKARQVTVSGSENKSREVTSELQNSFLLSELDTIIVKEHILHISQIPKSKFLTKKVTKIDTSESKNLTLDSARVNRNGRKLIFKIASQKEQVLEDTSPEQEIEAEADLIRYKYLGNLKDIYQWLVHYSLYEGDGYLLIDQRMGKQTPVYGIPAISPDKKSFVCGSVDLIAGYNPNGLQLFKVSQDNIKLEWERSLEKWGPEKLVWESMNSFLAEQVVLDSDNNEQKKYIRLTLKKN